MTMTPAHSKLARQSYELVKEIQARLVNHLERVTSSKFSPVDWLRNGGQWGGGRRYAALDHKSFNRASVNVSQVHYDNEPTKPLGSATALSTIVHPRHPLAPSMHMHISWTQMKSGEEYWRLMADLNPSCPRETDTELFKQCLKEVAPHVFEEAATQGDRYFFIPALGRHRGVSHFYLENYSTGDFKTDAQLAKSFGEAVSDCYAFIISHVLSNADSPLPADERRQLDYHTLYFFQVLTLDRGTTSGLLVHDDNDVGVLGSLPARIDRTLLSSWLPNLEPLHQTLAQELLAALPEDELCEVSDAVKVKLAATVRNFYRHHPEATDLLARGDIIPTTTGNHR